MQCRLATSRRAGNMYMYVYVNLWVTPLLWKSMNWRCAFSLWSINSYLSTLLYAYIQKVPVTLFHLLSWLPCSCIINISHVKINVPGPPSCLPIHTWGGPKNEAQLWKEGLFQRMLCNVNIRGCVWPSWLQPGWRWPPSASPSWGQPHEQRWTDANTE